MPDAEVDRLRLVVALGAQHDPLGGVLDEQEFTRRVPRSPDLDLRGARLTRVDAFLDQRRNDV